jgi:hypothetical protein
MKLTKKNIAEAITPLFEGCNMRLIEIDQYGVKISVWNGMFFSDSIKDLIKILQVIDSSTLIKSSYDVWRDVGYYEATEDITLNFDFDKDELKKL